MKIARFLIAIAASPVVQLLLSMFISSVVSRAASASKLAYVRASPIIELHLGAFLVTAVLLTTLSLVLKRPSTSSAAAGGW